jgi:hypothetical protein
MNSDKMAGTFQRLFSMTAAFLAMTLLAPTVSAQDKGKAELDETAKQRVLEKEAASALWSLKYRLEKEGFYSGRVALNVWRSAAIDAGNFDPAQYNEFKLQLYEKSIRDSLKCFENFLLEEDYYNANMCLQTWRIHSKDIGSYDQAQYEALKEKMKQARTGRKTAVPDEE